MLKVDKYAYNVNIVKLVFLLLTLNMIDTFF